MRNFIITSLLVCSVVVAKAQTSMSLAEYRAAVVERSFQVKIAQFGSVAAMEQSLKARKAFLPTLAASGDFSYNVRKQPVSATAPNYYQFGLQPQLVETLYGGGAVRNAYSQAKSAYRIAQYTNQYTVLEVAYAADYVYWNLAAAQELYATSQRYVDIVKSLEKIVTERFTDGYISKTDLLMVQSRMAEAEYSLLQAKNGYMQALMNFNNLLQIDVNTPVSLSENILTLLAEPAAQSGAAALERRPDYMASQENIRQSEFARRLAASAYNPQVSVGITGVWQGLKPTSWRINDATGIAFAKLSVPIFSWGQRRNTVRAARASERIAEANANDLKYSIILEVEQARVNIEQSMAQVGVAVRALKIATESLDLNSFSYSEGKLTILDVLSAQLSWIQSYTNTITANLDNKIAVSQYHKAVGDK